MTITGCGMVLLLFFLTSCVTRSPSARWRAPDSTLRERLLAAEELCPLGTTAAQVQRILGDDGHFAHYYGPTVKGNGVKGDLSVRKVADHDDWALEYEVSGGKISFVLGQVASSVELQSAIVTEIRCMKRVPVN